jgi:hypothetical protein
MGIDSPEISGLLRVTEREDPRMSTPQEEFDRIPSSDEFPGAEVVRRFFDLTDRIALVTGAASGLGRQIALGLASFGADLAVADINFAGAEETARKVHAVGRKAMALQVDITKWEDVRKMVDRTTAEFGRIDICFNIRASTSASLSWTSAPRSTARSWT